MTTDLSIPNLSAYALTNNWLDTTTGPKSGDISATMNTPVGWCQTTWQPHANYWYYYPVQDHRPVKLGLSEVEKLRSAAKRDAKLKKILEKFTDQIEVVVDFK